jgi:hypothetical protein
LIDRDQFVEISLQSRRPTFENLAGSIEATPESAGIQTSTSALLHAEATPLIERRLKLPELDENPAGLGRSDRSVIDEAARKTRTVAAQSLSLSCRLARWAFDHRYND